MGEPIKTLNQSDVKSKIIVSEKDKTDLSEEKLENKRKETLGSGAYLGNWCFTVKMENWEEFLSALEPVYKFKLTENTVSPSMPIFYTIDYNLENLSKRTHEPVFICFYALARFRRPTMLYYKLAIVDYRYMYTKYEFYDNFDLKTEILNFLTKKGYTLLEGTMQFASPNI